jgi:hypothetical protein
LVIEYVDKMTDGEYSRNLKSSLMSIANNWKEKNAKVYRRTIDGVS